VRYSFHKCVPDWTLEYLNHEVYSERWRIAIHCVAASVRWESEAEYWVRNRRVLLLARRFQHARLAATIDWNKIEPGDLYCFAGLYQQNDTNSEAKEMGQRTLRGKEKAWGADHTSTLDVVNNFGFFYKDQGRLMLCLGRRFRHQSHHKSRRISQEALLCQKSN
jgi:hypothetical protein